MLYITFSIVILFMYAQSLQLCSTLCNPMNCSLPGSSVHGILQARILEWVAMLSSKRLFQPRDPACDSCFSFIAGRFFIHWDTWEAPSNMADLNKKVNMKLRKIWVSNIPVSIRIGCMSGNRNAIKMCSELLICLFLMWYFCIQVQNNCCPRGHGITRKTSSRVNL